MKPLFIIFLFCLSFMLNGQNLIISAGKYYSHMTVSLLDPRPGKGEINSKTSYSAFDFNILIESKTFDIFSFKSGIYIHKGIYDYRRWSFEYVPLAGDQWSYTDEHYVMPSIIIPLLVACNFKNKNEDKKLRFHIDAGLFLDYRLFQSDEYFEPYDLYKLNIGGEIMAGIGTKKWQLSGYLLNSFRNMAKPSGHLEKTKGTVYGVNLTRIICLRRKSTTSTTTFNTPANTVNKVNKFVTIFAEPNHDRI